MFRSLMVPGRRRLAASCLAAGLALATARVAAAQDGAQPLDASLKAQYLADLDTVQSKIMQLAEAIPAEKYSWRPTAETRSVAEVFMHIVTEWYYWTPRAVGGQIDMELGAPREVAPKLEKIAAKAEVMDHLRKSWTHCRAQIAAADPGKFAAPLKMGRREASVPEMLFATAGDLHEHLGQLVTYTRSVGEVPPWSKKGS